jgi:hypothetical protein
LATSGCAIFLTRYQQTDIFGFIGCGSIACAWIALLHTRFPEAQFYCYAYPGHTTTLDAITTSGLVVKRDLNVPGPKEFTVKVQAIAELDQFPDRCTYIFFSIPWHSRDIRSFRQPVWARKTMIVVGPGFGLSWRTAMPDIEPPLIIELAIAPFISRMTGVNTVCVYEEKRMLELGVPSSADLPASEARLIKSFFPMYADISTIAQVMCMGTSGAVHVVGVLRNLEHMSSTEAEPFYRLAAQHAEEIWEIDVIRQNIMMKINGYSMSDYRMSMRYNGLDYHDDGDAEKLAAFYDKFEHYKDI